MSPSATSSDRRLAARLLRNRFLARGLLALALLVGGDAARGEALLGMDEALALAFPDCDLERRTVYLKAAQLERIGELAGEPRKSALAHVYRATRGGRLVGTAYFDTHVVRTLPETILVVVDPGGRVLRVEVVSFREPPDYLPREGWYGQFDGRTLDDELSLDRGIRPITGATLTARATTSAVRRVLALHRVLDAEERR